MVKHALTSMGTYDYSIESPKHSVTQYIFSVHKYAVNIYSTNKIEIIKQLSLFIDIVKSKIKINILFINN